MLELVDESDVSKYSLKKVGKKFLLYEKALGPHIEAIRNGIAESETGSFKIKEEALRELLGIHLKDNSVKGIYTGLRHCLWKYRIVPYTRPRLSGKRNFYFRNRRKSDTISPDFTDKEACDADRN